MHPCQIGLIGLAVMGRNLALNIASQGYSVAVYNRTADKTRDIVAANQTLPLSAAFSLSELVAKLEKPRKIFIMVQAGQPVDQVIEALAPLLTPGDIIIDAGNSHYQDTQRRSRQLADQKFYYLGLGVSGGEEGALKGPSLMPGGDKQAYQQVAPLLTAIAAQAGELPCCSYIGPDGAGHYVKMIHNGIEYGDMQLIAEAYYIMQQVLNLSPIEQSAIFSEWNQGGLQSYLIEITADILQRQDIDTKQPMLDVILDAAGQKGTGKWTVYSALDLSVPIPTIIAAVNARFLSAQKTERQLAAGILTGAKHSSGAIQASPSFVGAIQQALYAAKICSYAQGFALLQAASRHYSWQLDFGNIALLWRGGCIIRAQFLDKIQQAFAEQPDVSNLMLSPYFAKQLTESQDNWRKVIHTCNHLGVPIPAMSASLQYYDAYRQVRLPANLLQAQRDYFGAHTYQRIDKVGVFHSDWSTLPKLTQ